MCIIAHQVLNKLSSGYAYLNANYSTIDLVYGGFTDSRRIIADFHQKFTFGMQRRKLISFLWVYGLFPPVTFTLQSVQIVLFRFECSLIWKVPHIKIDEILIWIRNKIELNSESFTISIIDTWMGGRINEVSFFSATNKKIIQFIIEVIWCGIPRYFCTRFSYMEMVMLKPRAVFHEAYRKERWLEKYMPEKSSGRSKVKWFVVKNGIFF